ncbi:MAG TPA: hypothetical protein VMM18_14045 [Gemmatimonadaceae bacterium]|nr:hypothetical protein [Gemmatimonadaceae bacterium]
MTDGRDTRHSGPPQRASGPSQRSGQTTKQRLIAAATERLPFKAAALFFALVLWLIVSAEEPVRQVVAVAFVPVMDTAVQIVGPPPAIQAEVVGSRGDLLKLLTAQPEVEVIVPTDVGDSVIIGIGPDDVRFPGRLGDQVRVVDVQPRVLLLRFAAEMRRTLPIRSELRFVPEPGLTITGPPRFEPESVRVVGPRRRVRALEAVRTIATELVVRDTQPMMVPLDTAETGARVTPVQVQVRVPVAPDTVAAVAAPATAVRGGS